MVIAVHEAVAAATCEKTVTVQLLLPLVVLVVEGLEDVLLLEEVLVLVVETLVVLVGEELVLLLDEVLVMLGDEELVLLLVEVLVVLLDLVLVLLLDEVFVTEPPLRQLHALEISAGTAENAEAKAGIVGVGSFV